MAERGLAFLRQLRELWGGLSNVRRIALISAMSIVLVGVLVASTWGSFEEYGYLYTDLEPEDAAAIVEKLEQDKTKYRLANQGTAILVPKSEVHEVRLALAGAGLPRGGSVGFELFDQARIGATEFEQQVNLRRALEGELVRTLSAVDGVSKARVHLVLPERRLFTGQDEKASASVVLKLENPAAFSKREVVGIVHLVASAVPGLSHDNVSVVSTDGITLHRPNAGGAGIGVDGADLNAEQARSVGVQLEDVVREQLERVVGPGNADVRVNVLLDPAVRERTEEHYEPTKTALRSEHKVEETAGGGPDLDVTGVPGALSNLPDGDAPPEDQLAITQEGGGGGTGRRSQTRNWEVDRVLEKTQTPPGQIKRLTVAVLVNGTYRDGAYVPRNKKELVQLETMVKHAVGFAQLRGDEVSVSNVEFAREPGEAEAAAPVPFYVLYWQYLAAAAAALVLFLAVVVLVWRRRARKARKQAEAQARAAEALALPSEAVVAGVLEGGQYPAGLLEEPTREGPDFRARALELAAKDPATAAVVLRKWLHASTGHASPVGHAPQASAAE